jgi:MoxR-like ATPase
VTFTRKHRRVYLGASPRAALALLLAAKGRALLKGRDFVLPDDVKYLAPYVLSHRVLMTPEAELEGAHADAVVGEATAQVPYRRRR